MHLKRTFCVGGLHRDDKLAYARERLNVYTIVPNSRPEGDIGDIER